MLFGLVPAVPLVVLAVSIVEGYQLDEIGFCFFKLVERLAGLYRLGATVISTIPAAGPCW